MEDHCLVGVDQAHSRPPFLVRRPLGAEVHVAVDGAAHSVNSFDGRD